MPQRFLTIGDAFETQSTNSRNVFFYDAYFEACPELPYFQTPDGSLLNLILKPNKYSWEQIQFLAGKIFDANKLTMTLVMMQQARPLNFGMRGQKTTFQIVNEIQNMSQEVSVICLPDWQDLQPMINDYLMKVNGIKSSEVNQVQTTLRVLSGNCIEISELRKTLATIIKSDHYYEIFSMVLKKSSAVANFS